MVLGRQSNNLLKTALWSRSFPIYPEHTLMVPPFDSEMVVRLSVSLSDTTGSTTFGSVCCTSWHTLVFTSIPMGDEVFVHDHSLRSKEGGFDNTQELEADQWAEEALIPKAAWDESGLDWNPSGMAVIALALDLGVHPAIVAGRVRYETGNYRLLSQFVGTGQVRRQFE